MPESDRTAIQYDLIWTGDYNGMASADFGDNSVEAVRTFQKRNGDKDTGILTPDERSKLADSARSKRERTGWRIIDDGATGARLGIPSKLLPQSSQRDAGTHWQSVHGEVQVDTFRVAAEGTTLASVLDRMKKDFPKRAVEYQVLKPDFFVISGLQNGVKKFYTRAQIKNHDVRGVTILYDLSMEYQLESIAVTMSNAFAGFPSGQILDTAEPAPPRDVEYATGIVVSAAGDVVTDRRAVDDCKFVVVQGRGHAERIAEDTSSDLALLHVADAKDLVSAPVAGALGDVVDVTLIGIADPQAQNGGGAVSTVKAHVVAGRGQSRAIERLPALGFAGAAAVDGEAKLLGMVRSPGGAAGTQAAMVPAEAIRMFLYAHGIAPTNGRISIDDAKASVVRLICVRK